MLRAFFDWCDQRPDLYWIIALPVSLWLIAWTLHAARTEKSPRESWKHGLAAGFVLASTLLAWRWPWLLCAHDFGPDESQHVAGVLTLARDPLFFRAVDGATSGPLNFYVPLVVTWLLGTIDFFTVRCAALLMVFGTVFFTYLGARLWVGELRARLGVMPLLLFYATTSDEDFLHYTTEHLPVCLFAASVWCLARAFLSPRPLRWLAAAGLVTGLAPWAKLQIGPISATLILGALAVIAFRPGADRAERWKQAAMLCLCTLVPTLLFGVLFAFHGLVGLAWDRYILQSLIYVHRGEVGGTTLESLWQFTRHSTQFILFLATQAALVLSGVVAWLTGRRRGAAAFAFAGALFVVAVVCVLAPGRPFRHYWLVAVVPLTWWGIGALALWGEVKAGTGQIRALVLGLLLVVAGGPIGMRMTQPVPFMFGQFAEHWRYPRAAAPNVLHRLSRPGDEAALWGYAPELFAETGLPHATRDSDTFGMIGQPALEEGNRALFLADIRRKRPALFVDTAGPGAVYYPFRETQGHEIYADLCDHVAEHYRLAAEVRNFRFYVRADLFEARRLTRAEIDEAIQRSRRQNFVDWPVRAVAPPAAWRERVGLRTVVMLPPPTELMHPLKGDEREVRLGFGFHPQAVRARASNGAVFIVELRNPAGESTPVFRRFLNPQLESADRREQDFTIPLPLFTPGSHLIIRTESGPDNDAAWDWLYLSRLQFRHHFTPLASQFPGFGRVPRQIRAHALYRKDLSGQTLLMQHAPAEAAFLLSGRERRLSFHFGFHDQAYVGDNRTDGATFRVERRRAGEPSHELFVRRLDPLHHPEDRGDQSASVALDGIREDDELVLTIHPGASEAWDWTYLTRIELHGSD